MTTTTTARWTGTGYTVRVRAADDFDLFSNAMVSSDSYTVVSGTAAAWGGSGTLIMIDHMAHSYGVWACWADETDQPVGFFVARCADSKSRLTDDQLIDDAMRRAKTRRAEKVAEIQALLDAPIGSLESDGPQF